ncbi:putative Immunoglobulin superfamily containing leucine-rich repeat protein [Hypsibius exemplaris]|uniref:Immunoglobulin superfamily containing leucine-rich repeat protein n=1 Tax=Hypsibius exemplaris TaxID=2072580 RepID=A0A1W0X1H7_HYPEX|nr:putative Immunoglobulin superfamily containing leucine-rich repeat protein [Hypsibius exemplaris]
MDNWSRRFPSLLACIFLFVSGTSALPCPNACKCEWRNGLPTADCSNLNLTAIPSNIPSNVLVLDLSGNSIRSVGNSTFLRHNLAHLIKLDLSHCELERLEGGAFRGMSNLRELNLDGNNFPELPHADVFRDIRSLRSLSLRFNSLRGGIPSDAFEALQQLETLDLSSSQINHIDEEGFGGLANLRSLQLNGNQLRRLTVPTLISLKSLQQLDLHNNPWNCDCRVRDVNQWMHQRQVGSGFRPACAHPAKLQGVAWDAVPTDQLVCAPEILSIEAFDILPGRNISIECAVFGDPLPTVTWYYQHHPVDFHANASKYEAHSQNLTTTHHHHHQVHILIIRNASEVDGGLYQCRASNRAGNTTGTLPLFQPTGLLTPIGIAVLAIALLVAVGMLVALVLYCRRCGGNTNILPLSKLWTKDKIPSLHNGGSSSSSSDKFHGVTYFRSSDVTLSTSSSSASATSSAAAEEAKLLLINSDMISVDSSGNKASITNQRERSGNLLLLTVENEVSGGGGDRISSCDLRTTVGQQHCNGHEEDKDSGIQHEEDSSVGRNDSSAGTQDCFPDSDHESGTGSGPTTIGTTSVTTIPGRSVTFSPNMCAPYPVRSSLRRSPALSHGHGQPLKVNFVSSDYDTYLGTEV